MVDLDGNAGSVSVNILTELEQTRQIVVMIDTQLSGTVGACGESTLAFSTMIRPVPPFARCS